MSTYTGQLSQSCISTHMIPSDGTLTHSYTSRERIRTIFTINELNGDYNLVCAAGGILIGCRYNGIIFWLMQRKIRKSIGNYHIYEDFGGGMNASDGPIHRRDTNISDTIYREACEETNNILSTNILDELYCIGQTKHLYVADSKYLMSIVVFDYTDASDKLRALFNIRNSKSPVYIEKGATLHWMCQIPIKLLNPRIRYITNLQKTELR